MYFALVIETWCGDDDSDAFGVWVLAKWGVADDPHRHPNLPKRLILAANPSGQYHLDDSSPMQNLEGATWWATSGADDGWNTSIEKTVMRSCPAGDAFVEDSALSTS